MAYLPGHPSWLIEFVFGPTPDTKANVMPLRPRFRQQRDSKDKIGFAVGKKVDMSVGLLYPPCMKSTHTIRDVKYRKENFPSDQ